MGEYTAADVKIEEEFGFNRLAGSSYLAPVQGVTGMDDRSGVGVVGVPDRAYEFIVGNEYDVNRARVSRRGGIKSFVHGVPAEVETDKELEYGVYVPGHVVSEYEIDKARTRGKLPQVVVTFYDDEAHTKTALEGLGLRLYEADGLRIFEDLWQSPDWRMQ